MSKVVLPIGGINLLVEEGVQKIEITLNNQIDLLSLLTGDVFATQFKAGSGLCSLEEYFERQLLDLDLPITTYRQKTYYAFKVTYMDNNLCYYNANNRVKYLNVSLKESIAEQVFKPVPNSNEPEEFFWVDSSYEQFQEDCAKQPSVTTSELLEQYKQSRQVIPVDIDTRFRNTKRVRLCGTGEIDSLITALLPVLTDFLTLTNEP